MREDIREELDLALGRIDRPGSFCASGSAPAVLPGLEVQGLGPIGLPLSAQQAKELIKHCHQAPYGQGTKTVVDTSVRRVWRLEPKHFSLTNPDWTRFIETTVDRVRDALGLEREQLEARLYDLLLYEKGSFFRPHRDGEKLDRMVATLVVVLPSKYEGGELVVRHDGQERTIDFRGDVANPLRIHYAAFYADCEHEIRPLRKGYRLCLVYNLSLAKATKKTITAPRPSEPIDAISQVLRAWAADDSARKLAVTLEHQYTQEGLTWDALKGDDRARAHALLEAARRADCKAHLALLTLWEEGAAEEDYGYGSRRRRRWDDEDEDEDDNAGDYRMEEVFETRLTAAHWSDPEGHRLPIGELGVAEDEVLDPDSLRDVKPEEEYEGYTGNEGMTLERWYRHAAIVLWPERRHFETLCERDSRDAVPVLTTLVAQWRRARAKGAAALNAQCTDLAATILARWPENRFAPPKPDDTKAADLLEALAALDDPRLIRTFLRDLMIRDVTVDPGKSLVEFCRKRGGAALQEDLQAVMQGTTSETMERNVRLLEQLSSAKPRKNEGWDALCTALAHDLVSAVEAVDQKRASSDWRARDVDRGEVLAGLTRALLVTGQGELLTRVVDHALATPNRYPLRSAHLPALEALRPWLKRHVKEPCPALTRWLASCREQLEALTAREPQEPQDFRRAATVTCDCADCAELKQFLRDPHEAVHRFRINEKRRNHLEEKIRAHKCDLDRETDRSGSPHTLVCTKNTATYREKLRTYHQDQESLAAVRALAAGLPG